MNQPIVGGARNLYSIHGVQTDSEPHPSSYLMIIGAVFSGLKRPECELLISVWRRG
jgi:hypothetical protein